jgi:ribosome modulation factor
MTGTAHEWRGTTGVGSRPTIDVGDLTRARGSLKHAAHGGCSDGLAGRATTACPYMRHRRRRGGREVAGEFAGWVEVSTALRCGSSEPAWRVCGGVAMNAAEERALFVARLQQAVRDAAVLTRSLQTARQLVGSSIESMELAVLTGGRRGHGRPVEGAREGGCP